MENSTSACSAKPRRRDVIHLSRKSWARLVCRGQEHRQDRQLPCRLGHPMGGKAAKREPQKRLQATTERRRQTREIRLGNRDEPRASSSSMVERTSLPRPAHSAHRRSSRRGPSVRPLLTQHPGPCEASTRTRLEGTSRKRLNGSK